jgi:DNA repair ATPase RecN
MVKSANRKLIKMGVTKIDESRNRKEIDRLERKFMKLNSEAVKLDGEVHPLFVKLGTTSDRHGVISWIDGYPKKELLEKYPEKKADAEKYTKLFRKLESKRKAMRDTEKRKNQLEDELDESIFQGKITPSKVDSVRTKHLFQRHPEVVGYSNNWWMTV